MKRSEKSFSKHQQPISTIKKVKSDEKRPEVYTTIPPQPKSAKAGQLNKQQLQQYFNKGFVVVDKFFELEQLDKVKDSINQLVDDLAEKLFKAGLIQDKHENRGFSDRLTLIEAQFKGAAVILHKQGILPESIREVWSCEKLLNVVEQLIGPDIAGHPVWNLRTKTPRNEQTTVPWHQDNAYLSPLSLDTLQVTAWIPLIDANRKNGCIQVASGGHRKGKTVKHTCCAGGTWYVELDEMDMKNELDVDLDKDVVTCEVEYGGVLLMNNAIPHRSLENFSDIIRWSLDLRWQHPDHDNGFYGLKNNVLMRSSKESNLVIDWSEMIGQDRTKLQMKSVDEDDDDLVPEICGPWMERWDVVHHNRHTERFVNNFGSTNYHKA